MVNCTMGINCGNYDGTCYQNECISEMQFGWIIFMQHPIEYLAIFYLTFFIVMVFLLIMEEKGVTNE